MSVEQRANAVKDAEERLKTVSPAVAFFRYGQDFGKFRLEEENVNALKMQAMAEAMKANATTEAKLTEAAFSAWMESAKNQTNVANNIVQEAGKQEEDVGTYLKDNPLVMKAWNDAITLQNYIATAGGFDVMLASMKIEKTGWFKKEAVEVMPEMGGIGVSGETALSGAEQSLVGKYSQ
jgi:hypothetical protein